jgi:hypothetical protein
MRACLFLLYLNLMTLVLIGLMVLDHRHQTVTSQNDRDCRELAEILRITDLAIWTEARYTRHPSQADVFAAFQNCPAALDHFPSGVWISPAAPESNLEFNRANHR